MTRLSHFAGAAFRPLIRGFDRLRLPRQSGELAVSGLQGQVQIDRDRWGIPHIQATCRSDLFFAQGFTHAQDRLWQMELNRRAAKGCLAALLGPEALESDRLSRTLGFSRLGSITWARTSRRVRKDILSYTSGVNAYLDRNPSLPPELLLLRHRPEPWSPLDSAAYGRLMAWSLSHGWAGELVRAKIRDSLEPDLAAEIEPAYPDSNPIVLDQEIDTTSLKTDEMLKAAVGPFLPRGMEGSGRGSNGWVIAPERSATGHPILSNDMHLPIPTPSLWYYLHLYHPPENVDDNAFHVAGVSLPGLPYILVGHNEQIAWGATLSFIDCEDLFVEKLRHSDLYQYEFEGQWREAQVFEERIQVRGRPDHRERVLVTCHGPIISPVIGESKQALALQSAALIHHESFEGFSKLNSATGWNSFVEAVRNIETPSLNLVYADVAGNIGYYVSGKVPIRSNGRGTIPCPGWTGRHEWKAFIPFEEMPHILNPPEGFLVTANNRIVDNNYDHYLGCTWMNGYRAKRIVQLLSAKEKVSIEDCRRFQMDFKSLAGMEFVRALDSIDPSAPEAAQLLEILRTWDGWLGPESIAGAVYQVLQHHLTEGILGTRLDSNLLMTYLGLGPHPLFAPISEFYGQWTGTLLHLLAKDECHWIPSGVDRSNLVNSALTRTWHTLADIAGSDPAKWHWGRLHQAKFRHALAQNALMDSTFSIGPMPIGGDTNTVCQTATMPGNSFESNAQAASYRQIIDLGNMASSLAMLAPGQSGRPGSPHCDDLTMPWLEGDYFPMTWDFDEIGKTSERTLFLVPRGDN